MSMSFPLLRPFSRGPVRVQTASEAASFDEHAIDVVGVPQPVLMENAGRSAAAVAGAAYEGSRVVAFVGSGNNGGDALVALRSLAAWGYAVRAVLVSDRSEDDPLLHGWSIPVVSDGELDDDAVDGIVASADFVLDGILGTGVRGAPRERQARVIERLNAGSRPIAALDVPSGIDASTGEVPGAAVRASLTVSFGAPKLGALLHPALPFVGRHVTVEIGFPPISADDASAFVVTPQWARARMPVRDTDTHKNRVGRVLIVGGGVGMAGAVVLAGQAAFRAGAGLVRIASPTENRDAVHAALPEAIFVDAGDDDALARALAEADAVAVGPGMGTDEGAAEVLRRVVSTGEAPLLLDADALNLSARGAIDLSRIAEGRAVLITPHPGEMARILGGRSAKGLRTERPRTEGPRTEGRETEDGDGYERSPPATARAACERFGCTVLFKGAPSVVAALDRPLAVDTQGSSDLAVAGMGDTLTGVCASLMAQGLEPATAGALGLYLSGRAARLAGRGAGLTPSDVAGRVSDALAERGAPHTDLDLPFVIFDADPAR